MRVDSGDGHSGGCRGRWIVEVETGKGHKLGGNGGYYQILNVLREQTGDSTRVDLSVGI